MRRKPPRVSGRLEGTGARAVSAERPEPSGDRLLLKVPGRAEAVRVVRAVVRSWAASAVYYVDDIEELCLAVNEAFAGLVESSPEPGVVTVRIRSGTWGVDVLATRDEPAGMWPPVSAQWALIRRVLATLVDEVSFEEVAGRPAIRLTKRRRA